MKSLLKLFVGCLGLLLAGCDPTYYVEYEVENNSRVSASVLITRPGFSTDTTTLIPMALLNFHQEEGAGQTTKGHLDQLKALPFEISIINTAGLIYNKDASALTNWNKKYPVKKSGTGRVRLEIQPEDFD